MVDLTQNTPRAGLGAPKWEIEWPMAANSQLFAGAALMQDANGLAANVAPSATAVFLGFAKEGKDNRTGSAYGGLASSTTLKVEQEGRLYLVVASATTWALQDVGKTVYASDGNTYTMSAGTNNVPIGKVGYVPTAAVGLASGEVLVDYAASSLRDL